MSKYDKCSDFEEMLMWTSYRYCIGRHTYVVSMAENIGKHYYNKLSDEQKLFTANDIRKEIYHSLSFLPFDLNIDRWYNSDEYNPLGVLFNFFEKENIQSIEELAHYSRIDYDVNKQEYKFNKCESNFKSYISKMDIDDLIPWETLASLFDVRNHKELVLTDGSVVRGFKTWCPKVLPCENKEGYYRVSEFGWEEVWKSVDDFCKGNGNYQILNEVVKEIRDLKE